MFSRKYRQKRPITSPNHSFGKHISPNVAYTDVLHTLNPAEKQQKIYGKSHIADTSFYT